MITNKFTATTNKCLQLSPENTFDHKQNIRLQKIIMDHKKKILQKLFSEMLLKLDKNFGIRKFRFFYNIACKFPI